MMKDLPSYDPDERPVLIGLASSGGGSRAAYLTTAVLREIHRAHVEVRMAHEIPAHQDLLDQIDVISSVSGGSLSAAYFVLNKNALKSDADSKAWTDFGEEMSAPIRLKEWYLYGIFNPWTWIRVATTNFNRGNIARDYFNRVYRKATLADLPRRPALFINATDVTHDQRFIFTNMFAAPVKDVFGNITVQEDNLSDCAIDLRSVDVADAVYASSAYPIIYPNLLLNDWYYGYAKPGTLLLADGGLLDNSGLLTLFDQLENIVSKSSSPRFVLAIYIDASTDSFDQKSSISDENQQLARQDTYFHQGVNEIESVINFNERSVQRSVTRSGVMGANFMDKEALLLSSSQNYRPKLDPDSYWMKASSSGKLLQRPWMLHLSLADVQWNVEDLEFPDTPEWHKLLEDSGLKYIPPAKYPDVVKSIATDFVLSGRQRSQLDVFAWILVHGSLIPQLYDWSELARNMPSDGKELVHAQDVPDKLVSMMARRIYVENDRFRGHEKQFQKIILKVLTDHRNWSWDQKYQAIVIEGDRQIGGRRGD